MKDKKIIFIHLLNDYSGSPKVLSEIIKIVDEKKINYEVFIGKSNSGFITDITDKINFYFYKRFNNKYLTLISFFISQIHLFFKLLKYKRDENTIFYINTMLPIGGGIAGKLMNKKVIFHIHETSITPNIFKKFLRFFISKTADKIIFVSNHLKKTEKFPKEIPQKVIYNTLSKSFFKRAENFQYIWKKSGTFKVLMACSLKEYKGVNEFVEIARLCENKEDIHFNLVLNAEDGEINKFFENKNLPKNIKIYSKQKDMNIFYENCDLVLNLSRPDEWIETFGLTILEAMSYGISCIVPPVGGPVELIDDGINGYLISAYETDKIANTIKQLSKNKKKCLYLSENAKKKSQKFNYEIFKNNILKVLNE